MKPPVCEICSRRFEPGQDGDVVNFSDYEPLPKGMTGHPRGAAWFCDRHLKAAQSFADHPEDVVMMKLRKKYFVSHLLSRFR